MQLYSNLHRTDDGSNVVDVPLHHVPAIAAVDRCSAFEVHGRAGTQVAEIRQPQRFRSTPDLEHGRVKLCDRQADSVDRNGASLVGALKGDLGSCSKQVPSGWNHPDWRLSLS